MRAGKDVVWCPVEGEMVLFRYSEGVYYGLNEVGARIFTQLQDGTSPEETAARLVAEFEVDGPTARAAVERMLGELTEKGLLVEE